MAYNLEVPQSKINQAVMEYILHEYINSYHKTLSKYAGCKVTPTMVHNDQNLEKRIYDSIHGANWIVMNDPSFHLKKGTNAKVFMIN